MQLPQIDAIVKMPAEGAGDVLPVGRVAGDGFREVFSGVAECAVEGETSAQPEMRCQDMPSGPDLPSGPGDLPGAVVCADRVPVGMAGILAPQAQLCGQVPEGDPPREVVPPGTEDLVDGEQDAVQSALGMMPPKFFLSGRSGLEPTGPETTGPEATGPLQTGPDLAGQTPRGRGEPGPPAKAGGVLSGVSGDTMIKSVPEKAQMAYAGRHQAVQPGTAAASQPVLPGVPDGVMEKAGSQMPGEAQFARPAPMTPVAQVISPTPPEGEAGFRGGKSRGPGAVGAPATGVKTGKQAGRLPGEVAGQPGTALAAEPSEVEPRPAGPVRAVATMEPAGGNPQAVVQQGPAPLPERPLPERTQRGAQSDPERTSRDEPALRLSSGAHVGGWPARATGAMGSEAGAGSLGGLANASLLNDAAFPVEPGVAEVVPGDVRSVPREGAAGPPPVFSAPETPRNVALQIAEVIRASGERAVELRLQPEELGRVHLTMSQDATGTLTVSLNAERAETLDLLRRNIDMLGADLRELGYESVDFSFSGDGAGSDAPPDGAARRGAQTAGPALETPEPIPAPRPATAGGGIDLRL